MPIRKTVYDKEAGKRIEMWGIDAVEAAENDPKRYTLGKPAGWVDGKPLIKGPSIPVPKGAKPAPVPVPDQEEPNE